MHKLHFSGAGQFALVVPTLPAAAQDSDALKDMTRLPDAGRGVFLQLSLAQ